MEIIADDVNLRKQQKWRLLFLIQKKEKKIFYAPFKKKSDRKFFLFLCKVIDGSENEKILFVMNFPLKKIIIIFFNIKKKKRPPPCGRLKIFTMFSFFLENSPSPREKKKFFFFPF